MSECYESQKKLLKERIEKANSCRTLTGKEQRRLVKLDTIVAKSKRTEWLVS